MRALSLSTTAPTVLVQPEYVIQCCLKCYVTTIVCVSDRVLSASQFLERAPALRSRSGNGVLIVRM